MPVVEISTVRMSDFFKRLSGCPPRGSRKSMLCVSSGVVMMKMMSSTNAKSSSGVMLMSLKRHQMIALGKAAHRIKSQALKRGRVEAWKRRR